MTSPEVNPALSAALKGATLAFNRQKTDTDKPNLKPKPQPVPAPNTPNPTAARGGGNGALLAASYASRDHSCASGSGSRSSLSPSARRNDPLSRQTTGGSARDPGSPGGYDLGRELEHGAVTKKLAQHLGSSPLGSSHLSPGARPSPDNRSASFIAATLAASRSGSASPNPRPTGRGHGGHTPQWHRGIGMSRANSSDASLDLPDVSSIAPTVSLISMFEKQTEDTDPVKTPVKNKMSSPDQHKLGSPPKLRSLTPPRSLSPRVRVQPPQEVEKQGQERERKTAALRGPPLGPKPGPLERPKTPQQDIRQTTAEIVSPEPRRPGPKPNLLPPALRPKPAAETASATVKPETPPKPPARASEAKGSWASGPRLDITQPSPDYKEAGRPVAPRTVSLGSDSSNDSFVSASSGLSHRATSPVGNDGESVPSIEGRRPQPQPTSKLAPAPPKPRSVRKRSSMNTMTSSQSTTRRPGPRTANSNSSSNLPLDSLTSAILAGNLAAARHVPSPAAPPPLPAPRRSGGTSSASSHHHMHLHTGHHHIIPKRHRTGDSTSTSRSPQRNGGTTSTATTTLRTTLRRPRSVSDDEDLLARHRRHGKHSLRSGNKKHSHHEGARKRWRDEVSPRERKRYEAVWASNRGTFYETSGLSSDHPDAAASPPELVVNAVVRDIWSRSRLPFDELAEVWDLVYRGRAMGLNREEFVVGMWLIDQRLRGRKIPARVSDSVWDSTRGMRVHAPKGKGKGKGKK